MERATVRKNSKTKRFVMLTVAAMMLVMLGLTFLICCYTLKAESHVRYVSILNVASERIAKTIRGMEMSAKNIFDEVQQHLDSPDAVIAALREIGYRHEGDLGIAGREAFAYDGTGEAMEGSYTATVTIGATSSSYPIDTFETAATLNTGSLGIFHGMKSYFCQDEYGQIAPVYSISAGLDYPGIGPEHAYLHDSGRAEYVAVTDEEAVQAFEYLSRTEGIIPAIESAHAVAHAMKLAPTMGKAQIIVINISGRGDKDCAAIARYRGEDLHD